MTTVGGPRPELPPFGLSVSKRSGLTAWLATLDRLEGCPTAPWSPPPEAGPGLVRVSFSVEVDEVGVRFGDWLASLDEGEAVPSLESLFFFEDLLGSLPRESYSQKKSESIRNLPKIQGLR